MGTGQLIEDTDNDVAVEHIVKSTKEPTWMGKQSKKRQLEKSWEQLIGKAVKCLDHVATTPADTADGAELFGRYVASEMQMLNTPSQQWVKLQIQKILFNASSQLDGNRQFASAIRRVGRGFQGSGNPLGQHLINIYNGWYTYWTTCGHTG